MKINKVTPIIAHAAGWLCFFSLVTGFLYHFPATGSIGSIIFSWPFIAFSALYIVLFYLNTYVLIPGLYLRKKYFAYFLTALTLLALVYFIRPFDQLVHVFNGHQRAWAGPPPGAHPPFPGRGGGPLPAFGFRRFGSQRSDIMSMILFITVWSLSMAACIVRQWRMTEKRAIQAEADKANAELSFLKAQINPHFLYNTLNNIYSLAVTKNENVAESIMKLSNIMRYVTDDVSEDFVSLDNEIDCIRDYIDLQRLRLGRKMNVDFTVNGRTNDKRIAPLILMTFVENVFKYGISNHSPSDIIIRLTADEHSILFFCVNKLHEMRSNTERTGIGITNSRQRLQHLYPGRHSLDIKSEDGFFTVSLKLPARP